MKAKTREIQTRIPCLKCKKKFLIFETRIYYEGRLIKKRVGARLCHICKQSNKIIKTLPSQQTEQTKPLSRYIY